MADTLQEVFLGETVDQCGGLLTVKDKGGNWVEIPRGKFTKVYVKVDSAGYWFWRCGSTKERSRGAPSFRKRVKLLKVHHSTENRKITWRCFDLVDDDCV